MQGPVLSEGYFSAVLRASQDVVRIVSLEGHVEYMNERGQALLEISDFERNRGRLLADLWPAESHRRLALAFKRARRGQSPRFVAPCPTARGRERWWSHVISPVMDERGEIVRFLVTSRDITSQRRREARLKRALRVAEAAKAGSAAHFATLRGAVEALPVGVALYDAEDRLLLWNAHYVAAGGSDNASSLLKVGRSFEDLLRRSVADGAYPDAVGDEEGWIRTRLEHRAQACGAHEQRLSDGRWFRVEDRRLPSGGWVAIAVDISRHKAREAALSSQAAELDRARAAAEMASQAKTEFLANMSHEIRTPLNGVLAMAHVLADAPLPPRDKEAAKLICSSGETLERLLSDILDLAKVEAGQLEIELTSFHVGELARSVAGLGQTLADAKGVTLSLSVVDGADRYVAGDEVRIRQVVTNLLSNAIKFTPYGSVTLTVSRTSTGAFRFSVQDTGVGFGPQERGRIFERFQQADGTISRSAGHQSGGAGQRDGRFACGRISPVRRA